MSVKKLVNVIRLCDCCSTITLLSYGSFYQRSLLGSFLEEHFLFMAFRCGCCGDAKAFMLNGIDWKIEE